jgi:hypothetical protein
MKRKKGAILPIALAFIFGLAACGNSNTETTVPETESSYSQKAFVSVESDLYGWGDTDGGTCIPRESDNDVTYDSNTSAVMTISLADGGTPDPALIDTSNAYVQLDEGDGYYTEDLEFNGTALDAEFENGTLTYHLQDGDLNWVNDSSYEVALGGLEWSAQGGDGNGHYIFNLSVCGITYDGEELAPGHFRAEVYIYGREFSKDEDTWGVATINKLKFSEIEKKELADVPTVDKEPVWTWVDQAGFGKPVLCDYPQEDYDATDEFYISWPSGVDASALTADDITITLTGTYTDIFPEDQYVLVPNTGMVTLDNGEQMPDGDYSVFADSDTTQIAVNMIYWAYTPVYTTMTVSVNTDKVEGYEGTLEKTYDIASVYTYRVQTGGGSNQDGTVTCQSIFGVENIYDITIDDLAAVSGEYSYSRSKDGDKAWLIENEDGTFTVTKEESEATVYPDTDPKLLGHVLYNTQHEVKVEYNGAEVTFKMNPTCTVRKADLATIALVAKDGYALSQAVGGWGDHMNWPWLNFLNQGWRESDSE